MQDTTHVRRTRRGIQRLERRDTLSDTTAAKGGEAPGAPFPAPDSVMKALMARPGYRPVVYQGDTLHFSAQDRSIRINQRAQIDRAGERLAADSVQYDGDTHYMTAYGQSKLVDAQGQTVTSDVGPFFYNTNTHIGTVLNAHTKWQVWNVAGNFTLQGNDTLWVRNGVFTSCDLAVPHYYFAANRIKMILGHIVVAWPVRLHFGEVPVLWLPFFAQDIRKGRHSGILTPRFGLNDIVRNSGGYHRHVSNIGYYWAISDYMDAQLGLDWWSSRWTRIDGYFRYRWRRAFLDGRLGYSQFFLPDGGRELSFTWNHSEKFGERSDLRASVEYVSSQRFRQQNEFDPQQLVQQIRSNIGFNRRFDWGTLSLSGERLQPLTEGKTTLSLPQMSLTLNSIEFFPAASPLEARWYNGLTWTGSGQFNREYDQTPGQPDVTTTTGGLSSGWSLSNLRLNSGGSYREQVIDSPDTLIRFDTTTAGVDTTIVPDTTVIGPQVNTATVDWRSSLGYQQRLIGSTTLTPALQISGTLFRSNETGQSYVSAPSRVSVTAGLNTDLYGFFPGFGPIQRIRHKFSPSFSWSYSPAVTPSPEIQGLRGFNPASAEAQQQISVTLSQTFEAKLKPSNKPATPAEAALGDTTGVDSTGVDTLGVGGAQSDTTGPAGPPQARKMTLLAIRTSALAYDLERGRLTSAQIDNNLTSDLLRGLTIRITHDLFAERPAGGRRFSPFLSALNLSFSLGARGAPGAGLTGGGISRGRGLLPQTQPFGGAQQVSPEEEQGAEAEGQAAEGRRGRRPWSASIDYSLIRQRPLPDGTPTGTDRQSVRANLNFSPTDNWTISWRTQYDLENKQFTDQVVSLRRDLHRWSANFDFLKAANGNFLFEFRVNLNDLPDLKFDYRQESSPSGLSQPAVR